MKIKVPSSLQSEKRLLKATSITKRTKRGSSLVETVVGSIFIVIIALFLVDVAAIVICQTQNDALAKHCARAASNFDSAAKAQQAINDVVAQFKASNGGSKICVYLGNTLNYQAAQVLVVTTVECNFPVPIPLVGTSFITMKSEATEPVVADVIPPI